MQKTQRNIPAKKKVPFDMRGVTARAFSEKYGVGESTIAGWKKEGMMPYWVSIVHVGEDPAIAEYKAEIERLNLVVDELIKRLAR